jgi:hypothetical protein
MIFLKLGNIFSKNKDPDQNILSDRSMKKSERVSGRKSMDFLMPKNEMRFDVSKQRKTAEKA